MRIYAFAGISLFLLAGCSSDALETPGTGDARASGGKANSSGGSATEGGSSATSTTGKGGTSTDGKGGSTNKDTSDAGGSSSSSNPSDTPSAGGSKPAASSSKATGGSATVNPKPTGGTSAGGSVAATTKAAGGSPPAAGGAANPGAAGRGNGAAGRASGGGVGPVAAGGRVSGGGAATTTTVPVTSGGGNGTPSNCANLSFKPNKTGEKPSGAAGGLKVLDWAGFSSAISYTFDDSNSSQIKNYQAMKDAGGHYTFYLITSSKSETKDATYKTALKDGHEMANHTSDHSNCSGNGVSQGNSDIKSIFGVTAYAFAAPNGSSACNVTSVSSLFLTDRSVNGGTIDPGDISKFSWLPSDIASASNMAPTAGKWRTICIHGFTGGNDSAYQPISLDSFTSAVKSAISGGSWVETVTNVAAYNWGQNAIKKGTGNKITWTLPSVFPSNMCVRVTTTGGTVKQNGTEVPWDSHGYYEISLDAKSLEIE